jgi:hypothetical protein
MNTDKHIADCDPKPAAESPEPTTLHMKKCVTVRLRRQLWFVIQARNSVLKQLRAAADLAHEEMRCYAIA